jgi:RNA polymerase sigma-70 factor (ECF subfamily)
MTSGPDAGASASPGLFCTTHWSVVLAARGADSAAGQAALETLCRTYWYPVYAFVRRRGHGVEDAQDLAQAFFLHLLERDFLKHIARERGRFRTFLLASLTNFLIHQWERGRALKRGGDRTFVSWEELGAEERYAAQAVDGQTPEQLYDHRWAVTVMEQALARLRTEAQAEGKERVFVALRAFLTRQGTKADYQQAVGPLGLTSNAAAVAVHRFRRRFGELVREVVAQTVPTPDEVEDELRTLAHHLSA